MTRGSTLGRLPRLTEVRTSTTTSSCEHCGSPIQADDRTITVRCRACALMTSTPRHPKHANPNAPVLDVRRPQPLAPTDAYQKAEQLLARSRASLATPSPSGTSPAATPVTEIRMSNHARADRIKLELTKSNVAPGHADRLVAAYKLYTPPEQSLASSDDVDQACRAAGGNPDHIRAGFLKLGWTPATIEARLASMVSR